ncbi:MAG: mannose-1-phosphate guanylyltransferase/mannose-6-phosphate isomerase [Pseudomonadota bacterium]
MKQRKIYPVILSGGIGTRLWPVSQSNRPKQILNLGDSELTMLGKTALRVNDSSRFYPITCVCADEYRFLIYNEMQSVNANLRAILLENKRCNTAPAIALAAVDIMASDKDAIILVVPSDHYIRDLEAFNQALDDAIDVVLDDLIVAFATTPTSPYTGFGYIEQGSPIGHKSNLFKIKKFHEKPNLEKARSYLKTSLFHWNCGIFMFKATALKQAYQRYGQEIWQSQEKLVKNKIRDLHFVRFSGDDVPVVEQSFDHAIMEKTDASALINVDMGWNDIGSWQSLWQVQKKDKNGNSCIGEVMIDDLTDSFIYNEDADIIVASGLKNIVVVASDGKVLVIDKSRTENVKEIVNRLHENGQNHLLEHKKTFRPWGSYRQLYSNQNYLVKKLEINPGESLSLQYHEHRSEHWVVVSGRAEITIDDKTFEAECNQSFYINKGKKHRLSNPFKEIIIIIEVQTGDILSEDDIVRLKDIYQRI